MSRLLGMDMTLSIDFDCQSSRCTIKIEDVRADRMLTAEAKSVEAPTTQ
jgi:hypothetical protein